MIEATYAVFELARGCVERIADRHVDVFVRGIVRAFASDHDLATWHSQSDPNVVALPVMVMPRWRVDRDVTRRDASVEAL